MHRGDVLYHQGLYRLVVKLMGNRFEISIPSKNKSQAARDFSLATGVIDAIEQKLSTYIESSETQQINRAAGLHPVQVSRETFLLIQRCLGLSSITQGAFDISYGSVDKSLWNFDAAMTALPDPKLAKKAVRLVDYKNILLDGPTQSVMLKHKGMRIGFGGIGKGYAADQAMLALKERGVSCGVVNASGDLVTWGCRPDGANWTVGIADPKNPGSTLGTVNISDRAIATSGNYEKYAVIDGKKYSHTINPRTGMPVSGLQSVSIVCGGAELADAMATPVMVMGREVGLDLIEQIPGMCCIIVGDDGQIHTTSNIQIGQGTYAS